jgi:hypothetical protein
VKKGHYPNCHLGLERETHGEKAPQAGIASRPKSNSHPQAAAKFRGGAAGRLIARRGDDPNFPSVAAAGTGRKKNVVNQSSCADVSPAPVLIYRQDSFGSVRWSPFYSVNS